MLTVVDVLLAGHSPYSHHISSCVIGDELVSMVVLVVVTVEKNTLH